MTLIGRVIDNRYLITSCLARGAMATVYIAVDKRLGRDVALKIVHPNLTQGKNGSDTMARFRREARAAAKLIHPGTVSVLDQGFDGEICYLVMEYVPGSTLKQELLSFGTLSVSRFLSILEQVLSALAAAHKQGMIHRDIKLENVLIDDSDFVRISDFGLAHIASEPSVSKSGAIPGLAGYLAPEVISGSVYSYSADVFAVGVLGYEILTGHLPYQGTTSATIAQEQVNSDIRPISDFIDWIPQPIVDFLLLATARDYTQRPKDAACALIEFKKTKNQVKANYSDYLNRRSDPPADFREPATGEFPVIQVREPAEEQSLAVTPIAKQPGVSADGLGAAATQHLDPQAVNSKPQTRPSWRGLVRFRRIILSGIAGLAMVLGTRLLFIQFYDANNENSDELSQLPSAEEVLIPSGVVGSESQIAQELLRSARVRFRTRFEYDDSVPRLHVVSLSHNEGEMIPGAEIITMVLSHGPARRALPQQIGLPGESAHETLTALGFVVEYADPINSDVIPADHVIFQEPNDGTWLLPGETVTLTISLGAAP